MEDRKKTSIAMKPSAKTKLERLKLRLRGAGIPRSVANESSIIEALILAADFDALLTYFERR
jgi:hypothetical protein